MPKTKKNNNNHSVFLIFLKLGLTSFGGPIAHIGYFHEEFVKVRKWLTDAQFSELVSLCHFLPGPASSQLGLAIGLQRAGTLGSLLAWLGFTLPSAFLMLFFGIGFFSFDSDIPTGVIHALKIVAVAVVAQALIGMAKSLTPDLPRFSIAILACLGVFLLEGSALQLLVIVFGALAGMFFLVEDAFASSTDLKFPVRMGVARICLGMFFILLLILPFAAGLLQIKELNLFDSFYRAGALVFGGGHVVLPLLSNETVAKGIISEDAFLVGYGAAQSVPGPLFTFASYLGAVIGAKGGAVLYSLIALIAIFTPAFLLVFGVLPFWGKIRERPLFTKALKGVNAAVVGLLAATFYTPLWTNSIFTFKDFLFAVAIFAVLVFSRLPVWLVVILSGLIGWFFL